MRDLLFEPLTARSFAAFGDVLVPPVPGQPRTYFEDALGNLRAEAWPSLSLACVEQASALPLTARQMERHAFSSQSFVPLAATSFLVVVAPHGVSGGPDIDHARAFLATDGVGVTYAADTWHHPLTVLQAPASFAVWMWRDGTAGDEDFVDVEPFRIVAGARG
ncbi:MAG: ureidoglycolate lyase [Pseudomonadota bacterium]